MFKANLISIDKESIPFMYYRINIKPKMNRFISFFILLSVVSIIDAIAEIRLPALISDGLVLQRDTPVNIWGWATADSEITVEISGIKVSGTVDNQGAWKLILPAAQAGGPYVLKISSETESFEISDVWFGEVWVCSGQSNMETTMERVEPMFPEEFDRPYQHRIKYFDVPDDYSFTGAKHDLKGGKWVAVKPETIRSFAAISYFFAKKLQEEYDVAVGVINASVGGSPIQAWLGEQALKSFPKDYDEAIYYQKPGIIDSIEQADRARFNHWKDSLEAVDLGLNKSRINWFESAFVPSGWSKLEYVDLFPAEEGYAINGVYWLRKEFHLDFDPSESEVARLLLGTLIDSDQTYVNGELVGSTGYRYPPRRYEVQSDFLKMGKNVITIRLVSENGRGGFVTEKPYQLEIKGQIIDLSKDWSYQLGAKMPPAPTQTAIRFKPMGLYNAMIAPLHNMTIKGLLWYQGESNVGQAQLYDKQLEALIYSWRASWGEEALPFIFVQLPNYLEASDQPQESGWAEMREVQRLALRHPNTGMAITIDVGEANDIHPLDKKTVAERLVLQAMKVAYFEKDMVFSGPVFKNGRVKRNRLILDFDEIGSGLTTIQGNRLGGFSLKDHTGSFQWVAAKIHNNQVEIMLPNNLNPVSVRYGWANNPVNANLINKEGMPASPFQFELSF